ASLPRPGALQHGGALYCACERQRATGATPGTNIGHFILTPFCRARIQDVLLQVTKETQTQPVTDFDCFEY
ncbi:hypothetical protein FAE36_23250, partial [Shigella sonnei]|nr:hypothetical protein [Shigella sonnei]